MSAPSYAELLLQNIELKNLVKQQEEQIKHHASVSDLIAQHANREESTKIAELERYLTLLTSVSFDVYAGYTVELTDTTFYGTKISAQSYGDTLLNAVKEADAILRLSILQEEENFFNQIEIPALRKLFVVTE